MQPNLIAKCNNATYVLVVGKWLAFPGFLSFHLEPLVPSASAGRDWEGYYAQHGRGKAASQPSLFIFQHGSE